MAVLYGTPTPQRRDAQRNRSAILDAAGEAMTTQRPAVGMSEIARLAGVGQATLYRHFPDRDALATAVLTQQIERLEALVAAAPAHPATFRQVLDAILRTQITMRPLVTTIRRMDPRTRSRLERRVITLLTGPLRQARDGGHVRVDLVPSDLSLLFTMVEGALAGTPDIATARAAAGRSIDLALDGLFVPR